MSDRTNGVRGKRRRRAMSSRDREVTRRSCMFYRQFHFPGARPMDRDGLIFMRRFALSVASREMDGGNRIRVLDAGCGTGNTSIALAHRFGEVDFTGVDISEPSLDEARRAARRTGVQNLRLRSWNLMRPIPYEEKFDIVLCLGVLHHTADMSRVLSNLSAALGPDGELYLWIYGRHGRYRHSLNVRLLRMLLGTGPLPSEPVSLARAFAFTTDHGSPLDDLLGTARRDPVSLKTMEDPVWIADQFLNPHETLLDMKELIALAGRAHLKIDQLLGMTEDSFSLVHCTELHGRFKKLPRADRLVALDLLLKPERYFVVMHRIRSTG